MQRKWDQVDRYFGGLLAPTDPLLDATLKANRKAGLPPIDVTPLQGRFLQVLAQAVQARRILEIGVLGGYSTIWLARALPAGGSLVTLESNPDHAAVARENLQRAGLLDRVDLRVAPALDTLPGLHASGAGPFDLFFIDADKENNAAYLEWALRLSRIGSLIVVDNVVRKGEVTNAGSTDPQIQGTRRFAELLAAEPRLCSTVLQTVGLKGHDGFAIAVVAG